MEREGSEARKQLVMTFMLPEVLPEVLPEEWPLDISKQN